MVNAMERGFEEVPHTADVALRIWGRDLAELFVNAARGMAWLIADPDTVQPTVAVPLELTAHDAETLLVSWLGELLYRNERDGLLFTDFDLDEITPSYLRGTARGGPAQETRHHIKAVTFSDLAIRRTERGLEVTVVFDV
jgi:SHS2 domain-containing protein